MDACSPPNIGRNDNPPPGEKTRDGREPQPTHDAYPVFRTQDHPTESARLGTVTELANGHIMGDFTFMPTSVWGCEWQTVPVGDEPPPVFRENADASGCRDRIKDDNPEPPPTHDAYAVNRSPGYPPEWVRLGSVTKLKNGSRGRFISAPTSGWSWKWLAAPIGEEPPPLSAEPPPARKAQQSRSGPERPVETFQPLSGEEDQPLPGEEPEPQASFSNGGEAS